MHEAMVTRWIQSGEETDLARMSTVRSNPSQELGFFRDPRRLCVAMTRARRGWIIVGNQCVLQRCRHWAALLPSCCDRHWSIDAVQLGRRQHEWEMRTDTTNVFDVVNLFDSMEEFYG